MEEEEIRREIDERTERLGNISEKVRKEILRRIPELREKDLDLIPFINSMAFLIRIKGKREIKGEYNVVKEIAEENNLEMDYISFPVKGTLGKIWESFYLFLIRGEGWVR